MKAVPEQHGVRIHTVRAWVIPDRPWDEAINAAGPNTPPDYNVRKVGHLYAPVETDAEVQEHILINSSAGDGSWDKALALGAELRLKCTVPREVFADGEQCPYLHRILGVNSMYVVATTECSFGGVQQACFVWWFDSEREAGLRHVEDFGNANDWFAFRKSSTSDLKP